MPTPPLRAHLFGPLALSRADEPLALPASPAARSLLAYLLLHRERPHPREALLGLFWPELPESRARGALRRALWGVRQPLGELVQADRENVWIPPDAPLWVDAAEFERLAQRAAADEQSLSQAIALYRGELLEGVYDDWALLERERLRELYLGALEQLATLEKAAGRYEAALTPARALAAADALREAAHREVMRLYHLLGRPNAALQQFETCRRTLAEELGVEPEAETIALVQEIAARAGLAAPPDLPAAQRAAAPLALDPHAQMPLVERVAERAALLACLEAALGGDGGMALLAGEAGVGKTRLLQALAREAEWRGARVLWGHGGGQPYGALAEALDAALAAETAPQLAQRVEQVWLGAASRLLPALAAHLPDLPPPAALEPEHEQARLLEALAQLTPALGQIAPLMLLLEDLHAADEATLDALAYLAPRLKNSRVLLVGSYRTEDARAQAATGERLQQIERAGVREHITLGRLGAAGAGELVRRGLGLARPAPLFENRLYLETDGNPLFVLETLRALHDEGLLMQDESGDWRTPWDETTADYAEMPLAPEVERVIAQRLARLPGEERSALNAAAVLERDFTFALLRRTSPHEHGATLRALNELIRRQLLLEEQATYRFSHDKIRAVAYAALPPEERQTLHRRAADALEAIRPEQADLLAQHCERGELPARAARYYRQAGERAAAVHAHAPARQHYDRAVELAAELPPDFRFALRAAREATLDVLGEREAQAADLQAMIELAQEDTERLAQAYLRRARLLANTSSYAPAEDTAQKALALSRAQQDARGQAAALTLLGLIATWRGAPAAGAPHLQTAVELYQSADDLPGEATAHNALANTLQGLKEYAAAREHGETALALCETLHDRIGQAEALAILGIVAMEQGAPQEAVACYQRELEISRAIGFRFGEARSLGNWGNVLQFDGQISPALERYAEAAAILRAIGHARGAAMMQANMGGVLSGIVGDAETATQHVEAALVYYRATGDRGGEGQCLAVLGEIARRRGDLSAARRQLEASVAGLQAVGEHWVEVQARQMLIAVTLAEARPATALQEIEAAEAICAELGMPDLATTLLAQRGQALLALGRPEAALAAAAEAVGRLSPGVSDAHVLHFRHYQALLACGRTAAARAALEQAQRGLQAVLEGLSPEQQQMSRARVPEHREILAAWEAAQPRRVSVSLPRADAPTGRPLRADEYVKVVWSVAAPEDEAIPQKAARRRGRLLRLLQEAAAQGAAPTHAHLAEALGVGVRTIARDMVALREEGHALPPGRKGDSHLSSSEQTP